MAHQLLAGKDPLGDPEDDVVASLEQKRKPLSPKHIQTVSKEPVSGIQLAAIMLPRARVTDEKARAELRPWVPQSRVTS